MENDYKLHCKDFYKGENRQETIFFSSIHASKNQTKIEFLFNVKGTAIAKEGK